MSDSLLPYGLAGSQVSLSMVFSSQEYWSGLPFPPPGDLPDPRIKPSPLRSPVSAGRFFKACTTWEARVYIYIYVCIYVCMYMCVCVCVCVCILFQFMYICMLVAQSCLTLCDSMDCSQPRSSVHGILQARMLEWAASPFSRGSY